MSAVLSALGYDVVTAPPSGGGRRIAAAVVRARSADDAGVEQAAGALEDGGVLVLITQDLDRSRLAQLLEGWRIEDQTDAPTEFEGGARTILTRAVLTVAK